MLTNPSGFAGIDGLFRFRADGTNERGLAVMKVGSGGGTPVAGSPKSFGAYARSVLPGKVAPSGMRSRKAILAPDALAYHPTRGEESLYAARSATTASSTGKPACVTRSRPLASTMIAPSSRSIGDAAGIERAARQRRVALGIDAFGEPQPHQQEFVGALFAVEDDRR